MADDEKQKIVFPYSSLAQATKDRFAQIGGPDQAFRFLKQGYLFLAWRKNWSKRKRQREAAEDQAVMRGQQ